MEYFKTVDPDARQGLTSEYWQIAESIWQKLQLAFPKTYHSLRPCLEVLDGGITSSEFDVLYGQVQSGKSRAMMMLCWYASFIKTGIVPVVLTIKLGSVRQDFQGKASQQGEINRIITRHIASHWQKFAGKSDLFQLKAVDFREYRKDRRPGMGKTLVLLQEPANLRELIRCYQELDERWSMSVIIDEAHKMYTKPFRDRTDGLDESQVNNMSMMYWLHEKARRQKIYLLGVTATPHRSTTDPHVYPRQLVTLDPDPIPSRCYYGELFEGQSAEFQRRETALRARGLIPVYPAVDVVETLVKILDRQHATDVNTGKRLVKVVLVVTDHYQSGHLKLRDEIADNERLGSKSLVWVVNSDKNVGENMAEEFEHLLRRVRWGDGDTQRRLATGILVIIGKGCFSAGVSVRPSPGLDISFKYGDDQYTVAGLTDQIYRPSNNTGPKNLETNIQAMRLFGYYPPGCGPNLWINVGKVPCQTEMRRLMRRDKKTLVDQFKVNGRLSQHYQGSPASIGSFTSSLPFELFADAPYTRDAKRDYKMEWSRSRDDRDRDPDNGQRVLLDTEIYPVGKWLTDAGCVAEYRRQGLVTIGDFFGRRGDQNRLRNHVKREVNERHPGKITDKFQIPYNPSRYRDILQAIVHPRLNVWPSMVKSFLTGNLGSDTELTDCYLTVLCDPLANGDDRDSDANQYCLQVTPDRWLTVHPFKAELEVYQHDHLDKIGKQLPDEHYNMLQQMDQGIVKMMRSGKPARNGYVLFMWWCRDRDGPQPLKEYGRLWRECGDQKFFCDGARQKWNLERLKREIECRQRAIQMDMEELIESELDMSEIISA